jgi:hypothetical protein
MLSRFLCLKICEFALLWFVCLLFVLFCFVCFVLFCFACCLSVVFLCFAGFSKRDFSFTPGAFWERLLKLAH